MMMIQKNEASDLRQNRIANIPHKAKDAVEESQEVGINTLETILTDNADDSDSEYEVVNFRPSAASGLFILIVMNSLEDDTENDSSNDLLAMAMKNGSQRIMKICAQYTGKWKAFWNMWWFRYVDI